MWPWRNSGDKCGPWEKRIGDFREIFGRAFSRSFTHLSTSSTTAEIKLTAMYSVSRLNQELECGDPMVPTEIPEDDIVCEHHVRNSVLHGRMKHIDIADHVSKDWHA